jgi:hypothetical protein
MLVASCHCGAVKVQVPRRPRTLTDCNCSICRRYGARWAYFRAADVTIEARRGATAAYVWGDRSLRFVRCSTCGCVTHWEPTKRTSKSRMGVNARNFEPSQLGRVRIRMLDGADTWKFLA